MTAVFRSWLLALCLASVVTVTACKRRKATEPVPVPAGTPAPAAPAPAQPGQPPPPAISTRESNDAAYIQEVTQTLNNFLGDYIRQHKRIPKDINEMVSLKIITSIPVLPGGKKWVIDQQTGKLSAK